MTPGQRGLAVAASAAICAATSAGAATVKRAEKPVSRGCTGSHRPSTSASNLVSSHDDTGVIDVLLNDGKGHFAPAPGSPYDFGRPLWGLAAGDLDGNVDLAIGHQNKGPVLLARGDGKGGFTAWRDLAAGDRANYVAIGDLDGDGRNDVVVSCYGSGEVSVHLAR